MDIDQGAANMEISSPSNSGIDEALYSRQIYVLGADTMKKMASTNILISGMGGLGAEIAKDIVLTGVKSVTIHDTIATSYSDLSANFYLNESNIGQNRASACVERLAELNQYVPVKAITGTLTPEMMSAYQVVIFTDGPIDSLVPFNEACRRNGTAFIAAEARGVFGYIFVDLGNSFTIYDTTGEEPLSALITSINNDATGLVTVHDDSRHGLEDGDVITFSELDGAMGAVLNGTQHKVKVVGPFSFTVGDLSHCPAYTRNGYMHQVKQPKTIHCKSLAESLTSPELYFYDFAHFERPAIMHIGFQALAAFRHRHSNELPRSYNEQDATEFLELCHSINNSSANKVESLDEPILKLLSYTARGNLSPVCAFLGGFAAQEVLKSCSGKFSPLFQAMYYDAVETLPSTLISEEEAKPLNCRYDGQIAVFGSTFQKKLADLSIFVVGAGALGCEFLKQYSLMGVGTGAGRILVTDMDVIETSNLSRQFLFRRKHIGKLKSETAAAAAKEMNPHVKIVALADKVAPETEETFDDKFWESLDGVVNALDNVAARMYVDSRCVYYRKPLLESGTLGTKANLQVVIPHLTESYASSRDPPEKSIPICTLKNFPNAIEHTIQWARDMFEGCYKQAAEDVNSFLSRSEQFMTQLDQQPGSKRSTLEGIHASLVAQRPLTFDECVHWARLRFEELYSHSIRQLLYSFPLDMTTSTGTPFWSGPKRPPTPLEFDINDEVHMGFIVAAANLRAQVYGLHGCRDIHVFRKALSTAVVPEFVPKQGFKIATEPEKEGEKKAAADGANGAAAPASATNFAEDEEVIAALLKEIPQPSSLAGYRLTPLDFEKDDDSNFHIDFITATSNLRARNYKIAEADRSRTKLIAGKIIPAMITTTALITGLVGIELIKIFIGGKKLDDYKNAFVNVALPFIGFSDPISMPKYKYGPAGSVIEWSMWDRFELDFGRDITMAEFIKYFETEKQLEVCMISSGTSLIYTFFGGNKAKIAERMAKPLSEVVREVSKQEFLPKQKYISLEIMCNDVNGDEAEVPPVRYKFRNW